MLFDMILIAYYDKRIKETQAIDIKQEENRHTILNSFHGYSVQMKDIMNEKIGGRYLREEHFPAVARL